MNRALLQFERTWLHDAGIPGRPWFKHLLFAPRYTYAAMTLPGITEAAEAGDWAARRGAARPAHREGARQRRARAAGRARRCRRSADAHAVGRSGAGSGRQAGGERGVDRSRSHAPLDDWSAQRDRAARRGPPSRGARDDA